MAEHMTEPLTPPGCDMSGNDWFPLHFIRLRKSKWWRRASDMARARNVMLWGEAYASVPAGSLADDDDDLAEAAGFGFDVEAFLAVKEEIMAPWVKCSDGRWYHPTMCEVALETWERISETRKKDALRKAESRAKTRGHTSKGPSVTPESDDVRSDIRDVTPDNADNSDPSEENGCDFAHRQTDRTGQDKEPPTPLKGGADKSAFDQAFEAYPETGRASTTPQKARNAWLTANIGAGGEARLLAAVIAFAGSAYAKADGGKRVPSFHKWLSEGRYHAFLAGPGGTGNAVWTGPPDLRATVIAAKGEDFARAYLDPAGWQDIPKAVIASTGIAADRLRREVGAALAESGVLVAYPGERVVA